MDSRAESPKRNGPPHVAVTLQIIV